MSGWIQWIMAGQKSSEYLYGLGLVLFVIGRWTHLHTLNSICHLSDHVWSWLRSVWRISWSVLEEMLQYIILSSAKRCIEDVTSVISDRAPLTETLCLRLDRKDLIQF